MNAVLLSISVAISISMLFLAMFLVRLPLNAANANTGYKTRPPFTIGNMSEH